LPEVEQAAKNREHRAGDGVTGAAMTNTFAANSVLLVAVGQQNKRGGLKVGDGGGSRREATRANGENDVAQAEGFGCGVGGRCLGILAGTIQKEKGHIGHVDDREIDRGGRHSKTMVNERKSCRLDAERFRIGAGVALELVG
jgi:hypothetical protein